MGENWGVDSGLELLVRDNPRDTHPALPSRAFTASKHRNGSNVNINPQTPGSIICYVLSNDWKHFLAPTDLKSPAQPPRSCLARLGPLSEVKITSVLSRIWRGNGGENKKNFIFRQAPVKPYLS